MHGYGKSILSGTDGTILTSEENDTYKDTNVPDNDTIFTVYYSIYDTTVTPYAYDNDTTEYYNVLDNTSLYDNATDNYDYYYLDEQLDRSRMVYLTLTPIILIIGLVGNGLSFAIMQCKAMASLSVSTYLSVLAVNDSLFLCSGIIWQCVYSYTR